MQLRPERGTKNRQRERIPAFVSLHEAVLLPTFSALDNAPPTLRAKQTMTIAANDLYYLLEV